MRSLFQLRFSKYPSEQSLFGVAVSCDGNIHLHLKVEVCRGNVETVSTPGCGFKRRRNPNLNDDSI